MTFLLYQSITSRQRNYVVWMSKSRSKHRSDLKTLRMYMQIRKHERIYAFAWMRCLQIRILLTVSVHIFDRLYSAILKLDSFSVCPSLYRILGEWSLNDLDREHNGNRPCQPISHMQTWPGTSHWISGRVIRAHSPQKIYNTIVAAPSIFTYTVCVIIIINIIRAVPLLLLLPHN